MSKTNILLKNVGIADLTFGHNDVFLKLLKEMGLHIEYVKVDDHKVEMTLWSRDGRCFSLLNEKYYISDKMTNEKVIGTCQEFIDTFISALQEFLNSRKED